MDSNTVDESGEFVETTSTVNDALYGDAGYEGEQSTSALSLDYYRQKATEFQAVMNGLDKAYAVMVELYEAPISEDFRAELEQRFTEFESKRSQFKVTAEAINAAAGLINGLGGRFPQLSIPGTLGLPPLLIPAGIVAAIATAGALAYWGREFVTNFADLLRRRQLLEAQSSPEEKAALARAMQQADQAQALTDSGPWAAIGSATKWIVLGVGAYLAYRIWQNSRGE
jgi:hypothetical protein